MHTGAAICALLLGAALSAAEQDTSSTTTTTTASTTTPLPIPTATSKTSRSTTTKTTTTTGIPPPIVTIKGTGRILGFRSSTTLYDGTTLADFEAYLSIPYANPPVGDLRFQAPAAYSGGEKDWNATYLPRACYQANPSTVAQTLNGPWTPDASLGMSEDCLYLNIWRPVGAQNTAVMVFIHGGGYSSGTASISLYDGTNMALNNGVVVVSLNYRLGPLGFLSLNDDSARGNYGLLDQQMALRWVQAHIAAFGGDPTRVTLFGESASVSYHLMSPGSASLFQSAIIESTVATGEGSFVAQDELNSTSMELANQVGCVTIATGRRDQVAPTDIVSCLRGKSAADLANAAAGSAFLPTVDGTFLTAAPETVVAAASFQRKSLLLGVNSDEGSLLLVDQYPTLLSSSANAAPTLNATLFQSMVNSLTGLNAGQSAAVAFEYSAPSSCPNQPQQSGYFNALSNVVGDWARKCPVVDFANAFAQLSVQRGSNFSVYLYEFVHRNPTDALPAWVGAALHGDELAYVFGQPYTTSYSGNFTDDDRTLSQKLQQFWTNFAKSGDPHVDDQGTPTADAWPAYTPTRHVALVLNTTATLNTEIGIRDRQCTFWSVLIPQLGAATTPTAGNGARVANAHSPFTAVLLLCVAICLRLSSS